MLYWTRASGELGRRRRHRRGHIQPYLLTLLALSTAVERVPGASALAWPFSLFARRTKTDSLVVVGDLGLGLQEGLEGSQAGTRLMAFGDSNGNQFLDIFTTDEARRSAQVYTWNHKRYGYSLSQNISAPGSGPIESIVPLDFDQDGKLDLLIMTKEKKDGGGWWSSKTEYLKGSILKGGDTGFDEVLTTVDGLSTQQPTVIDADGSLRPDLLALASNDGSEDKTPALKLWRNDGGSFTLADLSLEPAAKLCDPATPHSNAFVDLDGDCLADLFLECKSSGYGKERSFQIWRNTGDSGFTFAGEWNLPSGTGAISFADFDRDGTIDLIFPTCSSISASTGVGRDCHINIAYNKQKPLCNKPTGTFLSGLQTIITTGPQDCRNPEDLCTADVNFGFDLTPESDSFTSIPIAYLYPGTTSLLFSEPPAEGSADFSSYIPLRLGDLDRDGFPDILATVVNGTASPAQGVFGGRSAGVQAKLIRNVPCTKEDTACQNGQQGAKRRSMKAFQGSKYHALDEIWDVRTAAWIDLDEDGSLDIILQRTGQQDGQRFSFVRNDIFVDAFFLKATVLDGSCEAGTCERLEDGRKYSGYGGKLPGASYKFTVLDTAGRRVATEAYNALQLPYSYFGLGRTNNYVENLFVGSTLRGESRYTNLEGVIPNSQVVLTPPLPLAKDLSETQGSSSGYSQSESDAASPGETRLGTDGEARVRNPSKDWHKSLYIKPGEWVPWVIATLLGLMGILAGVVWFLHRKEQLEDEMERRKAMHRINFQAL